MGKMMKSHRYTIRIRTDASPAEFRQFIDDARETGYLVIDDDDTLAVDEIEGTEDAS
jgi:hypothetical protein